MIPQDAVCYLYVGKLVHKKRILDQLAALKLAHSRNSRLHLLVVGSGELMERARRFTDEHKLPVTFAGFLNQSEITSAYVAADCLILSSDYDETWGLVVNEAAASGLPLVISRTVGARYELVRDRFNGFLFDPNSVADICEALLRISRLPSHEVEDMGRRSLGVANEWTPRKFGEGLFNAAEAAVG